MNDPTNASRAALSASPHDNNATVSVHPVLEPTHICKDCGVPWRQCDDFTFNLRGLQACPACDNAPVGGQLISITAPLVREINRLRALSAPQAGYVLVPREPTPEMQAAFKSVRNGWDAPFAIANRAMLAAAPQPEQKEGEQT